MSGPQHIAWHEAAMRQMGREKELDLMVVAGPLGKEQFEAVRDALADMRRGDLED